MKYIELRFWDILLCGEPATLAIPALLKAFGYPLMNVEPVILAKIVIF